MAVNGVGGTLSACLSLNSGQAIVEPQLVEFIVMKYCLCLWDDTLKRFTFAAKVNQDFQRHRSITGRLQNLCRSKGLEA